MIAPTKSGKLIDPLQLKKLCWPHVTFYKKQREIIYSVRDNFQTICPAGNMLGKDFVAGFICVWKMIAHHPEMVDAYERMLAGDADVQPVTTRVVTTSVKDDHLAVLWGEINRFLSSSRVNLPFRVNHRDLRIKLNNETECDISYCKGMVSENVEGLSGHHATNTMFVIDEASGVSELAWEAGEGWMKKALIIGNPNPTTNFFYKAIQGNPLTKDPGGDLPKGDGTYHRKIITIKGQDSPNVQLGLQQIAKGKEPTNEILVPGVLTYDTFKYREEYWDEVRKDIGLYAEFPSDGSLLLFPSGNLKEAERIAEELSKTRQAEAIGCDPAEGGDNTSWAVMDKLGLMKLIRMKTPDTSDITSITKALINEFKVSPHKVMFDRGGGGKQHADRLRREGLYVQTVAFGESVTPEKKRGLRTMVETKESDEDRYVYFNRRAQMYHQFSLAVASGFALPHECLNKATGKERSTLREQLKPIPLIYDSEGRIKLPSKAKKTPTSKEITLTELIGHSPDESDAVVIGYHCMTRKSTMPVAGAV